MLPEGRNIIISDLQICQPGACLTRSSGKQGTWMLLNYETEPVAGERISGTMIYGGTRLGSPPLTLPLRCPEGWYKIYIGAWHDIHVGGSHLRLKLNQDRYFRQVGPETFSPKDGSYPDHLFGPTDITESFWRVAYLKDEAIGIDRIRPWTHLTVTAKVADPGACLAYIRLAPASEAEQEMYAGRGRTRKPGVCFAQYDNGNWWQIGCRSAEDIRASLHWFQGTDLSRINWGCFTGEGACYPSRLAQRMGREPEVTRCLDELFAQGVDPLRVASEYAREIGLGLYPSFRIGGKRPPPALPTTNETPFLDSHPQCVCVAADGTPTCHYSFAHEEVRRYFVNIVREVADNYDVPGVHFIFARSQPFVLYEATTVESFKKQHAMDPRSLPENDSRWQAHRASYLTEFIRSLRASLDEAGRARDRRFELAVTVPGNLGQARDWALDGVGWARQGFVDYLILHDVSLDDVRSYRAELAGVGVPLLPDIYPRRMPARLRLKRAMEYYEAGADGFCLWDSEARVTRASEFATARWLGHRDDLSEWAEQMEQPFRVIPLRTLQGYSVDRRYWTLTSG